MLEFFHIKEKNKKKMVFWLEEEVKHLMYPAYYSATFLLKICLALKETILNEARLYLKTTFKDI